MTTHRKRVRGQTRCSSVWRWLSRQSEPVRMRDAMAHFGIPRATASHTLRRLAWKGSAVRTGMTSAARWVATAIPPDDMRGLSVGSYNALMDGVEARGRKRRERTGPIQRKHDGSAIAQAWPMRRAA